MVLPRPTQYLVWKMTVGVALVTFFAFVGVGIEHPAFFFPLAAGGLLAAGIVYGGVRAATR